jgi:hypothetical protein
MRGKTVGVMLHGGRLNGSRQFRALVLRQDAAILAIDHRGDHVVVRVKGTQRLFR